jgi:hypothetical protein
MPGTRRAFRFGVVGERIRSKDQLVAEARRAEALGYATLLLRDPSSANRSVTDDHRAAADRAAVERGWGAAAAEQVLEMPSVLVGSVDRITEQTAGPPRPVRLLLPGRVRRRHGGHCSRGRPPGRSVKDVVVARSYDDGLLTCADAHSWSGRPVLEPATPWHADGRLEAPIEESRMPIAGPLCNRVPTAAQ